MPDIVIYTMTFRNSGTEEATKLGAPKATTAMAHRLARLVYRMLNYGQTYIDRGTEYYEESFRQQQIQLLRKRATKLGLKVAEIHA
jgi:transposase